MLKMEQTWRIDDLVWFEVSRFLAQPRRRLLEQLGAYRAGAKEDAAAWAKDLDRATVQLEQLEAAETTILDRFRRGLIGEGAMDRHLRDVGARRALLTRQVTTARQAGAGACQAGSATDGLVALLDGIRVRLPQLSAVERRDLVAALVPVGGIKLAPGSLTVRLLFAKGGEAHASGWHGDAALPKNPDRSQVPAASVELRVKTGRVP